MNRARTTYPDRAMTRDLPAAQPTWKTTLRRWMPLADPVSYVLAAAVLATTWAGPGLLDRILSSLTGAP